MCLFLTGATGLLGGKLLHLLREANPQRRVVVLVRQQAQAERFHQAGVRPVIGDLSQPFLGLDPKDYADLTRSATEIIHAGADVRFDQSLTESRAVNLQGVRHILHLARSCPRLQKMVHVSSVYVNGYRQGVFAEEPVPPGQRFVNSYQQSKHEGEALVLEAMRDIPVSMYRLSLVIADSASGHVSQFNYFHHLLRFLPGSPLPVMPGEPEIRVDLIPNDWAASAAAYIFGHRFAPGAIRHLCAGPDASIRLADAVALVCDAVEHHPSNTSGQPTRPPVMVSLGEYNRFVETCDGSLRAVAEALGRHVRLLGIRQSHLNALATQDLMGSGIALPPMADYLAKTVRYCLDTGWGKKPAPTISAAARAQVMASA